MKISSRLIFYLFFVSKICSAQFTPTYTGKPIYQIVTKRAGITLGTIKIELFPKIAYHHVKNFDSLVSTNFYDTTAFHRVIPGFMIQGGDPNSRHGITSSWGYGQPGQPTVNAEFGVTKHVRGILSAARSSNINSATSQFFICVATANQLNGLYSVYGRVTSGMNWVDTIVNTPRNAQDRPLSKIEMFVTRIGSNDSIPNIPILTAPTSGTLNIDTAIVTQLKWNAVNGALFYHVDVSTDSLFVYDIVTSVDLTSLSLNLTNLNKFSKYFWRVTANNGGQTSISSVWNLSTIGDETAGISSNLNTVNRCLVFPNPSSSKFSFLNLNKGNQFQIFDLNGKLIKENYFESKDLIIDLEGHEKGTYQYIIFYNKIIVQQGKLILK